MKLALSTLLVLVLGTFAFAQLPATPASGLAWDQDDADADTMTYWLSIDGGPREPVANVLCSGGVCQGDLPPLTVGPHTMNVVARRQVDDGQGGVANFDSEPSQALSLVFAAVPSTPQALRLR